MVRGLDYYMRTTFEVVHGSLGAQNSVLGGGRYDGLAESLGSKVPAPGIGFSIGEDRLVMSVEEGHEESRPDLFIVPIGESSVRHATMLARDFRSAGISAEIAEGKVKRAMEIANKVRARKALIIGENEIASGLYALKDMDTGQQDNLSKDDIVAQFVHLD
jgi:histidyl-tRNA synthetase